MLFNLALIPTIVFAIVTYVSAFKDGKPICDRYILNTYLYVLTYLFLMTYFVMLISQYPKLFKKVNLLHIIGVGLVNIGLLLAIYMLSPENYILKHFISVFFIAFSSFLLSFIFMYFDSKSILTAMVLSITLFVILTILAFKFQNLISSKISLVFLIVFILVVIAETIIGIFYPSSIFEKIIITVVLMFIGYLVLVKTKRMIENKEKCVMPDYVKGSIGFIMDIQSILVRILELKGSKRIR